MKKFYRVTHTQRLTDQMAESSDFVVDDSVSCVDYLCSRSSDQIMVTDGRDHTESDAASILIGETDFDSFCHLVQPKTPENKDNETSVENWSKHRARIEKIQGLMNNPVFQNEVKKIQMGNVDTLTTDASKSVGQHLKQIIIPSASGNRMVSPLHPIALAFLAGDLYNCQAQSRFLSETIHSKTGEHIPPVFQRFRKINSRMNNMQNTGISTAGKSMARMKNFPRISMTGKQFMDTAYPMRLSVEHPAMKALIKAIAYRHAYVIRRGGTLGNGKDASEVQSNRVAVEKIQDACRYVTHSILSRISKLRDKFHDEDDGFVPRTSWPEPLKDFMRWETPDWTEFAEVFTQETLRSLIRSSEGKGKNIKKVTSLFDIDKRMIQKAIHFYLLQKEGAE